MLGHNNQNVSNRNKQRISGISKYFVYVFLLLFVSCFPFFHITDANDALIAIWVLQGHRPKLDAIPADAPSELIAIIKVCWDDDPNERPVFKGL